jgi:hypothetical protein
MDPVALTPGGAGRYMLTYGDTEAEMDALSELGPFVWTVGSARHALIVSSETQWLWHELVLGAKPQASIRFLNCSFQQ